MVFCVAFAAWASFGQIDEVGHARGQLVPKGEVYKINPIELGKVVNIAIKEGETVKAGQVLVELDTTMAASDVERLQQQLASLQTEYHQKQILKDQTRAEAETRVAIAAADVQGQKAMLTQAEVNAATKKALIAQLATDEVADQERQRRLQPLTTTSEALREQLKASIAASKEQAERLKPLLAEGAISRKQLLDAEQVLRDRQSALIKNQLEESTNLKEQLFNAEKALRDGHSALTQHQGELGQILAQIQKLQAELTQKQAEETRIRLAAQQQIQQLEVEVTQLNAKIVETQTLLKSAQAKLQQRFLYAPVDGVVSALNIHNVGEVVQPGQTLAEMMPQAAPMVLSATLPNQEAGFVKLGMPVQIKFDAYPYQEYGIVSGKITSISPDAKPDERLGAVYGVEITLEPKAIAPHHQILPFKAGQTATADIIIRRRHIADILLEPIQQLQKGGISL